MADIPSGHRAGLVGRVHRRPAAGPLRASSATTSRAGDLAEEACHDRDRPARPSRSASRTSTSPRSAGSTSSSSSPTAPSTVAPLAVSTDDLARPRGAPADVLHRLLPGGRPGARPTSGASPSRRRGDDRQPALRRRSSACAARPRSRRATCEGFAALMHEHWEHKKKRSGVDVERPDRPLVRAGRAQRRARRQAGRRRRRRVPALLHRRTRARCAGRWPPRGWPRSASPSTTTAASSSSGTESTACSA